MHNLPKILITTPIFYPNNKPHIGSAHTMIISDFIHRSFKIIGYNSVLLTGTDEHGDKIYKTCLELNDNIIPDKLFIMGFLDQKAEQFKTLARAVNMDYHRFIRTTDSDHEKKVLECWNILWEKGIIYKGIYRGYYSIRDETFYEEHELVDGKSPTNDNVTYEEFSCYCLKSSQFEGAIHELYKNSITVPNNRQNGILQYIAKGIKDICISRPNGKWGIPIPNDQGVIYVWFDALINYLCLWENSRVIHVVGKDIMIFHGLHWPILLMALELKLFDHLVVHNWWLVNNTKMSKSLNNTVDPMDIVDLYGESAFRFYIIKENLMSSDGNFSHDSLLEYYNSFLVNKFSNMIYRVETIMHRIKIPLDKKFTPEKSSLFLKLELAVNNININDYVNILFNKIDDINREIDQKEIWKNTELCLGVHEQIKEIIYYMEPIVPEVKKYWNTLEPIILFQRKSI